MNEKTESKDFADEEPEDEADDINADDAELEADDVDIEQLLTGLGPRRRHSKQNNEPGWRKLEKYREKRCIDELISDFEDYDIDEPSAPLSRAKGR